MNYCTRLLGFNDKWLMVIGIPVIAFLITAMLFGEVLVRKTGIFFSACLPVSLIYTSIFWMSFRYIFVFSRIKFPNNKDTAKRVIVQSLLIITAYFLLKALLDPFLHDIIKRYIENSLMHEMEMTIASLMVTGMVVGIYESIYFYSQLQGSILEKEQLRRENIQSQLEGLKNQVNPHFLFNSLNTLAYIIPENPNKAVKFVQQLSQVYRYILEIREKKLIPLSEELSFLKSYTFLLKERFGENLLIRIDVPEEYYPDKIVPLALQILFENSIKHNIISTEKPLTIEVFVADSNKLVVKNNFQKKSQAMNSTKVGLENIRNRYRFFSEEQVETIVTPTSFVVVLPLIKATALV